MKFIDTVIVAFLVAVPSRASAQPLPAAPAAPAVSSVPAAPVSAAAPDSCTGEKVQLSALKKENDDLRKGVVDVRSQLDAKDKTIVDLQASLGASAQKISSLNTELANKEAERQAKAQQLATLQGSLAQLDAQANELREQKAALSRRQEELTKEKNKAQAELSDGMALSATDKQKLQAKIDKKDRDISEVRGQLEVKKGALEAKEGQLSQLSNALTLANHDMKKSKEDVDSKAAEIMSLNTQLSELHDGLTKTFGACAIGFAALIALIVFSGWYQLRTDVRTYRATFGRGNKDRPDTIEEGMMDDVLVHRALTIRLRRLIELCALATVAVGTFLTALLVWQTLSSSAGLSVLTTLANDLFWKALIGALAPLTTLVTIYQVVLGKGVETIAMCKELNMWRPVGASKPNEDTKPVAA